MRGILESVGIILNSAAVITISAALCKMVKNVRKIESEMKEDVFKIVCRVDKIDIETQRKIHNLSEEVKQIRIKSYEDRKPIQDALFTDSILITFSGGTEIKKQTARLYCGSSNKSDCVRTFGRKTDARDYRRNFVQGEREYFKSCYKDLMY